MFYSLAGAHFFNSPHDVIIDHNVDGTCGVPMVVTVSFDPITMPLSY